jgi:GxxExxY protein
MVYVTDRLLHSDLTGDILKCCFEVMRELGCGFLEAIYKNALIIALKQHKLSVQVEKSFEVSFRQQKIGLYIADLVVDETVVVELKCCKCLLPEHQAQTINYLTAADLPVGLLVNFGHRTLEYKRVHHPLFHPAAEGDPASEADLVF